VQAPTVVTAAVAFTLTMQVGYSKPAAIPVIQAAVAAHINAMPMGAALPYSRLPQVIYDATAGVANVTALLLNSGAADLGGATTQVVRAGSVTIA
jgi:hypothetical protein